MDYKSIPKILDIFSKITELKINFFLEIKLKFHGFKIGILKRHKNKRNLSSVIGH